MTTHRRDAPVGTIEKTGDRTRRLAVSDESIDRYNTTFAADGWETRNFEKNPVLLWCHNASALPVGKVRSISTSPSRTLVAEAEFFTADLNPDADRIMRMIDAGVLAVSHRFEPLEYKYNLDREGKSGEWSYYPPIDYLRQELLEVSIVTVPGNANALPMRDLKDVDDLRLIAEAAMVRAADVPAPRLDVLKLREEALAKRSTPAPAPTPAADPAPAKTEEQPLEEQELEVDGLDAEGVQSLVEETVKEVMAQRSRAADLRRRGELEVAS
jgi:hypothetical protein